MLTSHMLNRAPPPDPRERDWQELMAAWAERAYTLSELDGALHPPAATPGVRPHATLNGWATTVRREQPRVERHRQPRLKHLST